MKKILLTNDDGFDSPGLWAAAEALLELGELVIAAPDRHFSHFGRGFLKSSSGRILKHEKQLKGKTISAYSVDGSPAQTVMHAMLEIVGEPPDLLVSGINYGENVSIDVTTSGTVGAAFEGATFRIPSLASSIQILQEEWDSYHEIDFSVVAHFTQQFASLMLSKKLPEDVDVLNLNVPIDATTQTPWRVTRLTSHRYYDPYVVREGGLGGEAYITAHRVVEDDFTPDTDIYALLKDKQVSITPLSLDVTSRVKLGNFEQFLRKN